MSRISWRNVAQLVGVALIGIINNKLGGGIARRGARRRGVIKLVTLGARPRSYGGGSLITHGGGLGALGALGSSFGGIIIIIGIAR